MCYFCNNITYSFSIESLKKLREKFSLKICYKKKYKFLNLKYTPSQALANRLIKRGNFLKSYRILKNFYYIYFLRDKKKTIDKKNTFLFLFKSYLSFRDFDRVLYWKFKSLNCMFNYKTKRFRKKKKRISKMNFVFTNKRILLTINFIKCIILLSCKRGKKNMNMNLFNPLYDFIINDKTNSMLKVKFRLYRLKLVTM